MTPSQRKTLDSMEDDRWYTIPEMRKITKSWRSIALLHSGGHLIAMNGEGKRDGLLPYNLYQKVKVT